MVIALLFRDEHTSVQTSNDQTPDTRIVRFWIHQTNRLTDGTFTYSEDGTAKASINMSTKGKRAKVHARALYDGSIRRTDAGYTDWDDNRINALLEAMQVDPSEKPPAERFAEVILRPIRATESAMAEHLSILWDAEDKDISDAIGLRYHVVQKAEAILNDAGLLVDPMGTVVADDRVLATLEVTQFAAAKSLLMNSLSSEERRYNCRIIHAH